MVEDHLLDGMLSTSYPSNATEFKVQFKTDHILGWCPYCLVDEVSLALSVDEDDSGYVSTGTRYAVVINV